MTVGFELLSRVLAVEGVLPLRGGRAVCLVVVVHVELMLVHGCSGRLQVERRRCYEGGRMWAGSLGLCCTKPATSDTSHRYAARAAVAMRARVVRGGSSSCSGARGVM